MLMDEVSRSVHSPPNRRKAYCSGSPPANPWSPTSLDFDAVSFSQRKASLESGEFAGITNFVSRLFDGVNICMDQDGLAPNWTTSEWCFEVGTPLSWKGGQHGNEIVVVVLLLEW